MTIALELAARHVENGAIMVSSARLCLSDARAAANRGDMVASRRWALKSLAYSVGIFHEDYKRAEAVE